MDQIAAALGDASEYLRAHRAEARYADSSATATVESGLRIRSIGPAGEELWTDMPASIGGSASAPSPGWFLRAATAACVASLLVMRGAQLGIDVTGAQVAVDSDSDDFGILGLDDDVPAGPLRSRIVIRFAGVGEGGTPAATDLAGLEQLAHWAVDHCPVSDALRRAVPLEVRVEHSR